MSIIKVKCTDQVLAFENTPVIASGGLEENFIEFSFCSKWAGYARTAVFWRTEAEVYHVVLDENDRGQVPPEVTIDEGLIYFGVFGVDPSGRQRTSEVLNYRVVKGAITTGTKPSDPAPDIYTQIEAHYAELLGELHVFNAAVTASAEAAVAAQAAVEAIKGDVEAVEAAAKASQIAAEAAETAAAGANTTAGAAQTTAARAQETAEAAQAAAENAQAAAEADHAARHATGGTDPITPAMIGAVSTAGGELTGRININLASDKATALGITRTVNDKAGRAEVGITKHNGSPAVSLTAFIDNVNGGSFLVCDAAVKFISPDNKVNEILHAGNFRELGASKIATGTYVGTGTYGEANPNTLTFDFVPKLIVIASDVRTINGNPGVWYGAIIIPQWPHYMRVGKSATSGSWSDGNVSVSDNTVSWWAGNGPDQLNYCEADYGAFTYTYTAFG